MKKLIPAIVLLLISAMIMATASYAWFSMNNKVTVSGMEVKTKVSNNLLIDNYASGSWATNDSTFKAFDTQTIDSNNVIVPVSTVNGVNFFYVDPTNVAGDGNATTDTYIAYTDSSALAGIYSDATAAYLDYHFVLKADNTSDAAQNINLSKLDLTYSGAADADTAFRVAILANKFTTATVDGAKTAPGLPGTATHIYTPSGAVNYDDGKAVSSTTGLAGVTYVTAVTGSTIATVGAGKTEYYEVTVRFWLEGEDKTCTVETFKGLDTGSWTLDIEFVLETGTTSGKYNIDMITTP